MSNQRAPFAYRLAFVLLCFLPTVSVCGWIFARSLPGFVLSEKQEWERELSRRLGLRVTCELVSYPRPDTAELKNIAFAELETNEPVASIATLEVIREGKLWKLSAWQCVLESKHLPGLRDCLQDQLLRLPTSELANCEFTLRELTLRDPAQSLTLVDVAGGWQATPRGPVVQVQFRLPESSPQSRPALLVVERNRETIPPATRWQIDTGDAPLPGTLVAKLLPPVQSFGSRVHFAGQVEVVQSGAGFQGRLRGALTEVDLDALVSEQFPHQLTGLATCQVEEAEFDQERLHVARGTVKASHGLVSRSLLEAANVQMGLTSPILAQLPNENAPVSFRHLAVGFDLRDSGLQLTGSADPTRPNVLIACAGGSLLEAPLQHRVNPLALARTLVPDQESQVPAARATRSLASFLPKLDPQPAATALRQGHVPTRLAPARDVNTPVLRQPSAGQPNAGQSNAGDSGAAATNP